MPDGRADFAAVTSVQLERVRAHPGVVTKDPKAPTEETPMRNITRFGLAALLVTSVAGLASAQNRDGANKPSIGSDSVRTRGSGDGQHRQGREEDHARQSLSPVRDQPHPPRRPARRQRLRSAQRRRGPVHRLRPLLRRRLHAGVPGPRSPERRAARPGRHAGREREPAHHDRPRLQQRRRQPERQRADRPRHPRRDDELPLGAASPGVVGQGRLSPRRRLPDR